MRRLLTSVFLGLAALLMGPAAPALAQDTGVVQGVITEEGTETTLPGVNVVLEGTDYGTVTGPDGRYEIEDVPTGTYTVVASFTGYTDAEGEVTVSAGERVTQDLVLVQDVQELEEVVVSGYRVEQTEETTGAVSRVSGEDLAESADENFGEALQGRAAGVRITSASGAPGGQLAFDIRGSASVNAGTDPLYIIDGVQITDDSEAGGANFSVSPLSNINPNDIESIRVLKDVAAASIYGAQAANGVVIIETKEGRAGNTDINFSSRLGSVSNAKGFDVLSAEEYSEYQTRAYTNSWAPLFESFGFSSEKARDFALRGDPFGIQDGARGQFGHPDSVSGPNWRDAVFRNGLTQNYSLSARGGGEGLTFFISGNYADDQGQIIGSDFQRASLRSNVDFEISDPVEVEARINLSRIQQDGTIQNGAYINSPFFGAYFIDPRQQIYNEPGNSDSGFNFDIPGTFGVNLVAEEELNQEDYAEARIEGSVALNWQIADGLFTRTLAGLNYVSSQSEFFDNPRIPSNASVLGEGDANGDYTTDFNISQTINYDDTYGDQHDLSTVGGVEYRRQQETNFGFAGSGFPSAAFQNLANAANADNVFLSETEFRVLSFFGDAEYTFDDRYVLGGTLRLDGNSRFGENNRYGLFGSGSVAWRISEEAFMENVGFVDQLKLRASAGVTGNSQIGNFVSRALFGGGGEYFGGPAGGGVRSGFRPTQLGNPDLSWERAEQYNIGFDYALFTRRLRGSFNLYRNDTSDLLLFRPLPSSSGFNGRFQNVGTLRSEGIEIEVSTINLDVGGFRWDTGFNLTLPRTEVIELVGDEDAIGSAFGRYEEGEPIEQYYFPKYAGVNPADGRPFYYDEDGNLTYLTQDADRQNLGNNRPSLYGGLTNTFSYAGLTLDVFFQYDYGRTTFFNDGYFLDAPFTFNKRQEVAEESWSAPGQVTEYPKPYWFGFNPEEPVPQDSNFSFESGRWLEDASYIRLKNVRLGYTMPSSLTQNIGGVDELTLFVQGTNLATWTNDYPGFDPETVGTDLGEYPQPKSYTAGINVGL